MVNVINFLKNYRDFGYKIRLSTAKNHLEKLKTSTDLDEQKIMMLRIIEELISSTEDLTMWLGAISERNTPNRRYRDEWEYLLVTKATDENVVNILKEYARIKTPKGLLKKFKLPPVEKIQEYLHTDEETLLKLVEKLLEAIKASLNNRTVNRKVLLRFHNKVKHGMVVIGEDNGLYIRELKVKINKNTGHLTRRNRNLDLPLNIIKAEQLVGTIEANSYAIKTIIILLIADYAYQLQSRKRKLGKRQREFWEQTLKES